MSISGTGTISGTGYGFGQATGIEGRGVAAGNGQAEGTGIVFYRDREGHLHMKVGSGSVEGRGIAIGVGSGSGNGGAVGTGTVSGSGVVGGQRSQTDADGATWSEPTAVDEPVTYTTQSGEWQIAIDDTGTVTFTNTLTGATVESYGDPHVDENGIHAFDYRTDSVVALPNSDGTTSYVYIDNTAADATAGAPTYTAGVTIADPNVDGSYSLVSTQDGNLNAEGGMTVRYGTSAANPQYRADDAPTVTITPDGQVQTLRGDAVDQTTVDSYEA